MVKRSNIVAQEVALRGVSAKRAQYNFIISWKMC